MKKICLLLICLLCLTGCSKKITCTKETKNEDYTISLKSVYVYEKDEIKEIKKSSTITFKNEKDAKDYYEQYKETAEFNKQYGSEQEIKNIERNKVSRDKKKFIIESTYSNKEIKEEAKNNSEFKLDKENYIKTFEENGYECK